MQVSCTAWPPCSARTWIMQVQWYVDQVLGNSTPKHDQELFFTDPAVRSAFKACAFCVFHLWCTTYVCCSEDAILVTQHNLPCAAVLCSGVLPQRLHGAGNGMDKSSYALLLPCKSSGQMSAA